MKGIFVAILTQALLLIGTSVAFNQPSFAGSSDYISRVSTETVQKCLNLKSGGLILLDTEFGNVSIEEYDGSEVKIVLKLRGTPEAISNFRFTHNYFGSQLTLKGWYEKNPGPGNNGLLQAEFVVMVPKGGRYAVRTVTKQGNIDASVSENMTGVELSTETGAVRLKVPSDISASLDASTSGPGQVKVMPVNALDRLCPECEIRRNDHLRVKINGGGSAITAYSGIGSVYFEITAAKRDPRT